MKPVIAIINGPNLNRLGARQPKIYGNETTDNILQRLRERFPHIDILYRQANGEGELIDILQSLAFDFGKPKPAGIVFNPGAYAHYSHALSDAVADVVTDAAIPVIEVHISNIHARESYRAVSVISPVATGVVAGLGTYGYDVAVDYLLTAYGK